MILEYHRPQTLEEALTLLSRTEPYTVPLGGGTFLNRPAMSPTAVVDLQSLGLDMIEPAGNGVRIEAAVTLQTVVESQLPEGIRKAARMEAGLNLRQAGTVAGTLVTASSRSPFTSLLLALDARLVWAPGNIETSLAEFLPLREPGGQNWPGKLILAVQIPSQVRASIQIVSRTPADWALVLAAGAGWPSGRRRLVLGGYGPAPVMVVDGNEMDSRAAFGAAARDAYSQCGDEWATAQYRQEMATVLAHRCAEEIEGQ